MKSLKKSFSEAAGEILTRMLGPAADEIGDIVLERIVAWRWRKKNVEQISMKVDKEIELRKIDRDKLLPLSEGEVYRAVDACSLEDEELVQDLWAGLFASAMDPSSSTTASKLFTDILRSIGPQETAFLLLIHKMNVLMSRKVERTQGAVSKARSEIAAEISEFRERVWLRYPHDQRDHAIQNLMRLRCIGFRVVKQLKESALLSRMPIGISRDEVPAGAAAVARMLDYVESLAMATSGTGHVRSIPGIRLPLEGFPETRYDFTPLGKSLVEACVGYKGEFSLGGRPSTD